MTAVCEEPVFVASVHDVRHLAAILRGVSIHGRATMTILEGELRVRAEEAKMFEACAYIRPSIFDEYKYVPAQEDLPASQISGTSGTLIDIPIDTLLECLNIFGTAIPSSSSAFFDNHKRRWKQGSDDEDEGWGQGSGRRRTRDNATIDQFFLDTSKRRTGMRMSYVGAGYPLKVILAEDAAGPITTCEIQTMESEPFTDFPFDASRKVIYIILQSLWLRDALLELDPSCEKLTIIGIPKRDSDEAEGVHGNAMKPILRLSAERTVGSAQMDYPNDRDVLETFECAMPVKHTYHAAHIKSSLRALQSSSKTCLRIDDEGLLSLQFMMAKNTVTEFKYLPIEDGL